MIDFKGLFCALLFVVVVPQWTVAQNNTNSPYTRYGYGQLSDQNFANSKAMGGVAYGLRDGNHINPVNPASYTAIDSLTFLFDAGLTLQNTNFSEGANRLNAKNSSFDYVAMQFRVQRWMAMSIGLLPYSNVGYNMDRYTEGDEDTPANTQHFFGDGGFHQLYLGMGFRVMRNLSVGVNASYFWGGMDRSMNVIYVNTSNYNYTDTLHLSVRDYKLDFGIQYTQPWGRKHVMTVGAVYSPKKNLNSHSYLGIATASGTSQQVKKDVDYGLAHSFGLGMTYVYDRRLTVGADYTFQKWGDVKFDGEENELCDRSKIAIGAEYRPSLLPKNYLSHVRYRAGVYYSDPYYKIDGKRATREYGVSAGFGLPVPRMRSLFSISAQYIRVDGRGAQLINENYVRINLGLTFNERWFFKRKVE